MSNHAARTLSGPEKAAVLVLALGSERSAQLISVLSAHEIELLAAHIARTHGVDSETQTRVLEEFQAASAADPAAQGGIGYARELLTQALGPEKATSIVSRLEFSADASDFSVEGEREADRLGRLLGREHPQLAAAVLGRLAPPLAARVLGCLPNEMQLEVSLRLIEMDSPEAEAFRRLGRVLRTNLLSGHSVTASPTEGRRRLAEILNSADLDIEQGMLRALREHDPNLAQQVRDCMFTFEDLTELEPRDLQLVLRSVSQDDLRMALQTAGGKLKEHLFANMSERAAAALKEDMETAAAVKPQQARAAQQRVAAVARQLAKEGTLTLRPEAEAGDETGETEEAPGTGEPQTASEAEPPEQAESTSEPGGEANEG